MYCMFVVAVFWNWKRQEKGNCHGVEMLLCGQWLWHHLWHRWQERLCCLSFQCSRSCGGGMQRREALCKQRLADGSVLELPDTFCPSPNPPTLQPCDKRECPPRWVPTEWSQVQVEKHFVHTHWTSLKNPPTQLSPELLTWNLERNLDWTKKHFCCELLKRLQPFSYKHSRAV